MVQKVKISIFSKLWQYIKIKRPLIVFITFFVHSFLLLGVFVFF